MKLFLHWLRWDLRRFRLMLLVWTLLVICYAVFLGRLHLNILTVHPDWMDRSQPMAVILAGVEIFKMLYLFSTDPAAGAEGFWKTRPPSGFAIAAVKLVIGLGFFVALPMAAWGTMTCLCVPPEAVTNGWGDLSWTQFLWWWHALLAGALTLAAATVRHFWQIPLRVALAFALTMSPTILLMALKPEIWKVIQIVFNQTKEAFTNPVMAGWLLLAGSMAFVLARSHRTPARWWRTLGIVLPAVLVIGGVAMPVAKKKTIPAPEMANPIGATNIRVGGFHLRNGLPTYSFPKSFAMDEEYPWAGYDMRVQVSGLPGHLPADAGWRELRLTAPDGRILEGNPAQMQSRTIRRTTGGSAAVLPLSGAIFNAHQVAPFSLLPCRAEGVLRVMLKREESAEWVLEPGRQLVTPMARYELPEEEFNGASWQRTMRWITLGPGALETIQAQNRKTGERLQASLGADQGRTGFLLQRHQKIGHLQIPFESRDFRSRRREWELQQGLPAADWVLLFSWWRPDGYVDIPVVLEPFLLPRQKGDERLLNELIKAVPWPAEATPEQVRVALATVLILANQPLRRIDPEESVADALEEKLSLLTERDLPLLLETLRNNLPAEGRDLLVSDGPLKRRIVALLKPVDLDALRAEVGVFDFLKPELTAAGLIAAEEPQPKAPAEMSDQELEGWDREHLGRPQPMAMLEEAARRGLPWVGKSIKEILEVMPYAGEWQGLLKFLPAVSDCPVDQRRGRAWLRTNGNRLVWDAARKKWVVPPDTEVR